MSMQIPLLISLFEFWQSVVGVKMNYDADNDK